MQLNSELSHYINSENYLLRQSKITPSNIMRLKKLGIKVLSVCWHGISKSNRLSTNLVHSGIGSLYLEDGFCNLVNHYERGTLRESGIQEMLSDLPLIALIMSDFVADAPSNIRTQKLFPNLIRYPNEEVAFSEISTLLSERS